MSSAEREKTKHRFRKISFADNATSRPEQKNGPKDDARGELKDKARVNIVTQESSLRNDGCGSVHDQAQGEIRAQATGIGRGKVVAPSVLAMMVKDNPQLEISARSTRYEGE